jgi:hypothetical protein
LILVRRNLVAIALATILAIYRFGLGSNDKSPGRSDIVGPRIDYRYQGSTAVSIDAGPQAST